MSANVAFLTKLSQIADRACSDVAQTAARALVDAYKNCLYERLGIVATRRPTMRAKQEAMDEIDALRVMVFRAELGAEADAARIFAVAKQRIEMARRALGLRLVDDEAGEPAGLAESPSSRDARRDDRRFIDSISPAA